MVSNNHFTNYQYHYQTGQDQARCKAPRAEGIACKLVAKGEGPEGPIKSSYSECPVGKLMAKGEGTEGPTKRIYLEGPIGKLMAKGEGTEGPIDQKYLRPEAHPLPDQSIDIRDLIGNPAPANPMVQMMSQLLNFMLMFMNFAGLGSAQR